MENSKKDMVLVGYHHFQSKDKKEIFYIVQVLYNTKDTLNSSNKGTMINVFTDDEVYKKVSALDIGAILPVEIIPNLETGKIYYRVVI